MYLCLLYMDCDLPAHAVPVKMRRHERHTLASSSDPPLALHRRRIPPPPPTPLHQSPPPPPPPPRSRAPIVVRMVPRDTESRALFYLRESPWWCASSRGCPNSCSSPPPRAVYSRTSHTCSLARSLARSTSGPDSRGKHVFVLSN